MTICDSENIERVSVIDTAVQMIVFTGVDDVPLAASEWGERESPVVLLLHHTGSTRHAWQAIGPELAAQGFRVIALDTRGQGDSGWAPEHGDYRIETLVADVRQVVMQIDDKVTLIGAGLGHTTGNLAAKELGSSRIRAVMVADPDRSSVRTMTMELLSGQYSNSYE